MANNYLQFSIAVNINPDKIKELKAIDKWLQDVRDGLFENVDEAKLPDFIRDEDAVLFKYCQHQMLYEGHGFTTTIDASEYYVYDEEYGEPNLAAEWIFVLIRLELLKPERGYVVLTWAETCSKPRPDNFAGGAAVISRHGVKFQENAWEWAQKQYKEMCYAA